MNEISSDAEKSRDLDTKMLLYGVVALAGIGVVALGFVLISNVLDGGDLGHCDKAIQATLKAPSTYKRIDSSPIEGEYQTTYIISYDAQNSFGVPLRGKGSCEVGKRSGEVIRWTDYAQRSND